MSLIDLLGEVVGSLFNSGGAPGGPGPWTSGGAGPAMGGNGPMGPSGGQGGGSGPNGGPAGGGGQGGMGGGGNQGPGDDGDEKTDDEKAIDALTPDAIDILDLIKDILNPGPPGPGPGPVDILNYAKGATEAAKAGMEALKREKKHHDFLKQDFKGAHKDYGE